jgi:hypothetical protein
LQFGFRNDHGAIPACYVLKEAIGYYVSRGSPVFCTFLDNEKAFDRIWHNGLFSPVAKYLSTCLKIRI